MRTGRNYWKHKIPGGEIYRVTTPGASAYLKV
jgi:hypothetical protein